MKMLQTTTMTKRANSEAREIQRIVEGYFNLEPGSVLKRDRFQPNVLARNVIIYFLNIRDWEEVEIMNYFKMHRTTYYNSMEKIEDHVNTNRDFRNQFFELKDLVFGETLESETDIETEQILNYTWSL
jgi:chromosomal replication initiation ATPase DnaA